MSEEIKETLDRTLEYLEGIDKTRNTKILTTNETNILLDYVNNLQQKVEQLENIRKEAIEFMKENCNIITIDKGWIIRSELTTTGLGKLFKILNKGDNNVKDKK